MLRALAAGGRITADAVAGLPVASLRDLATRLREARYPVILWAARDLPGNHPDLVTGTLAGLIRDLNAKGRCSGVPLVGPDNIVGANQVCAWQTGGPLRTSFASGAPDHDPVRWSTSAALAAGAADCLVWISSIGDAGAARLARADHRPGAARARLARRRRGRDPGRHAGAGSCRQRLPHGRRGEPAPAGACATPACPASPQALARIRAAAGGGMTPGSPAARVYDPLNGIDGQVMDLWIRDGRIVAPPADGAADEVIDLAGKVVMPGGIDLHSHIGGGKVNIARMMLPEEHRAHVQPRHGALPQRQRPLQPVDLHHRLRLCPHGLHHGVRAGDAAGQCPPGPPGDGRRAAPGQRRLRPARQ